MKKQPSYKRPTAPGLKTFNPNARADALYKTTQWVSYRAEFLGHNPNCYSCGKDSTVVDHITPAKGIFDTFWKEENYLPLCASCHNTVTSLFDRNWRPGNSIKPKLTWLKWTRARHELSKRVKIVPFSKELLAWITTSKMRALEKS